MRWIMSKPHQLSRQASLVYGAMLLPINTFLKLYLRDQERYEAAHKSPGRLPDNSDQSK